MAGSASPVDQAYRDHVLAFRARGHHLDRRLPHNQLLVALAQAGVRDVRSSGLASLHARVDKVTAADMSILRESGAVLEVISARGTDTLVPAADVAVFTIGTLPSDEESLRARLKPWLGVLDDSGHTAANAVEATKNAAREALANGPLAVAELSAALTAKLPRLSEMCRGRCGAVHIAQGLFDLAGESGLWHQASIGGQRRCIPMSEPTAAASARRDLVRRYLGCYGPSTPAQFAEWCGLGVSDAARSLAEADTVQVRPRRYLLAEDVPRFESPALSAGVRFLPPRDPYLLDRDRASLIPDRHLQKEVWRATPVDGVVLVDGAPAASWRPKKSGHHLALLIRPFRKLSNDTVAALSSEAAAIADHRECTASEVVIA